MDPQERLGFSEACAPPSHAKDRSVLIWGALGFIGFHLTERLLLCGHNVSILCRSRTSYPEPRWASRVTWYEMDGASREKTFRCGIPLYFYTRGQNTRRGT
jgi:hypothetical protein